MEKIRIGIDSNGFSSWGGGIDFITTISEVLEATGKVQTCLIIGQSGKLEMLLRKLKLLLICGFDRAEYRKRLQKITDETVPLITGFSICSPDTELVFYTRSLLRFITGKDRNFTKCLPDNDIRLVMPSFVSTPGLSVPQIGYIYDFQHKYLKEFFTDEICRQRDKDFSLRVKNSKYLIVNAQDVKKDILKYYPDCTCEIIVLPFKPFQKPEFDENTDLKKYDLPEKYYMIANQFWMHKDHMTAFKALETAWSEGHRDMHIVCTGKMADDRNSDYIRELNENIGRMSCRDNIHFLGYIPKDDQLAVMKNAVGLIQPTLFEGGPGGGAVYNALCLGLPCLVSDIPVNKEITGYDNVYFFEKQNSSELARLMIEHFDDDHCDEAAVNKKIEENLNEYKEYLLKKILEILKKEDN